MKHGGKAPAGFIDIRVCMLACSAQFVYLKVRLCSVLRIRVHSLFNSVITVTVLDVVLYWLTELH